MYSCRQTTVSRTLTVQLCFQDKCACVTLWYVAQLLSVVQKRQRLLWLSGVINLSEAKCKQWWMKQLKMINIFPWCLSLSSTSKCLLTYLVSYTTEVSGVLKSGENRFFRPGLHLIIIIIIIIFLITITSCQTQPIAAMKIKYKYRPNSERINKWRLE